MVRKKSGRLFSYKYKHFASPGEHHLSVLFFPFTHLKAQFIDSSFPLSQLTFNRLPGRVVNSCFEALGGNWARQEGGVISLGLLQHWERVCLVHISFQSRTKSGLGCQYSTTNIPSDGKFIPITNYLGRLRQLALLSLDNRVLLNPGGSLSAGCHHQSHSTRTLAPWLGFLSN